MILTGCEDLRVQKTISAIDRTFEEMLVEMDYADITVKELAERAKINKKTFYRYYDRLDDLLVEKQESIIAECLRTIAGYSVPDELGEIIRAQFQFFHTRGGLYEKVICCGSAVTGIDYSRICTVTKELYWKKSPKVMMQSQESRDMLMGFINRNVTAFYRDWYRDGKKEKLEEMSDRAVALICGGVEGLLRS